MNLKDKVEELQEKYGFDIDDFMDLYTRKLSREDISARLGLSHHVVRTIGSELGVKWPKSKRAAYRVKFLIEYNADLTNSTEPGEEIQQENAYLSHKLSVANKALQRSRDEANQLRKEMRKSNRVANLNEEVLKLIEGALPIEHSATTLVTINEPSMRYEKQTSCIMLSDLHCEESVSKKDVGNTNEYTWEIMESRLDKVFLEWFQAYRGESHGIILLGGDVLTGLIHDSLENTSLHPMEAAQKLADILYDYATAASQIYEKVTVEVINGNHGRLSEHIKSANKGFDLEYAFGHILKAKLSGFDNVKTSVSTTGYTAVQVGVKDDEPIYLGMHHGDHFRGSVHSEARYFKVYEAFKNVISTDVTHIVQGHTHMFSHFNTHKGSYIVNGSLIGSNSYGVTMGFTALRPSQTLLSFKPNGDVDEVKQVFVD